MTTPRDALTEGILEEFDKKFIWTEIEHNDGLYSSFYMNGKGEIKSFIKSAIERAYEDGRRDALGDVDVALSRLSVTSDEDPEWQAGLSTAIDSVSDLMASIKQHEK